MRKICAQPWCKAPFEITDEDLAFYDRVSPVFAGKKYAIPPPTLCPDCRQQRRLAWRNERKLYHRTCDLTKKKIISCYSPDKPHRIYEPDAWNSDMWDPLQYGNRMDFTRPFFEQFRRLQEQVPRIALHIVSNENSPYINLSGYNKNCHLLFASEYDEDCLYGTQVIKSRSCLDALNCYESENCYEVVDCEKCYGLLFSRNCSNCHSSAFLADCKNCTDCLFCMNLRGKTHCVLNEQLTKESFAKHKSDIMRRIHTESAEPLKKEFADFVRSQPHRDRFVVNSENVEGDYIQNSKNMTHCFDVSHGQDCAYVFTGFRIRDMMDICHTTEAELGYEGTSIGYGAYGCLFSHGSWSSRNVQYCDIVQSCSDCFGCCCLRQKRHCILNKQYSKEEYEALVPTIITHMMNTCEWGQFFPMQLSPFAYNETLAEEYYPLSAQEVTKRSWRWREANEEPPAVEKIIDAHLLPSSIEQIPDDVLNWAISCEVTGKPFKIQKAELRFYRDRGLPMPRRSWYQRHLDRFARRNPRKFWKRQCANCGKDIQTTYSPDRSEIVYCESCYLQSVY